MSMQSHYEINVSKDGKHLFATAPRSGTTVGSAQAAFNEIQKRFPESEGFQIRTTYWTGTGCHIDLGETSS